MNRLGWRLVIEPYSLGRHLFPVNRHTAKAHGIHQMDSRKRRAGLRDSQSTDYQIDTSSPDDDDEDYKTYKPPSKVARKTKLQKSGKHQFASTRKNEWSLNLNSLQFQFDTKDPSVQCVTETEEATIKRYSEWMDFYLRNMGLKVDETGAYSHHRLRILAMNHLIQCLNQGQINDNFRKQTCGYNTSGYKSTGKSSNTMESIEEPNNIKSPGSFEAEYSGTSKIFDNTTKPIDEKEVKWKVGPENAHLPGFSSPPIDPREASFLHPALTCLKPRKPSEPFLLFGVDVKCVELEHIYSLEGIDDDRPYTDDVYNNSTEILSILEELYNEWCNNEKSIRHTANFLETLVNAMRHFISSKLTKKIDDVKKRMGKLMEDQTINMLIQTLIDWWSEKENHHMVEAHLQIFVRLILQIDGRSSENLPTKLTLFRKKSTSDGCVIVPDIEYVPLRKTEIMTKELYFGEPTNRTASCLGKITLAMFMKESNKMNNVTDVDKETETVILRPELLWRIFEQLLATIMDRELTKDKPVLFQGGLLIVGCKVRTVVLSIRKEVYTRLNKFVDVTEMLDFIKTNEGSWCTIYVQRSEHTIWDIVRRAKICYNNFTEH